MGLQIGIDVSKHQLDWAGSQDETVRHVRNDRRSVGQLVRRLAGLAPERIIVESTGGYERLVVDRLAEAGLPVVVVNPYRVRRLGEGLGILAKTDPIDAHLLALYGEHVRPTIRPIPQGETRKLADLVARRRQLIAMIVAEKSRLDTAPRHVRSDVAGVVKHLENRIARLDRRIDAALAADPERAELFELLQSVPGVGPSVARTLVVDLPELGHLDRREIASLVGVAPFAKDSGLKRGQRKVRGGRASVRTALYLAAMSASRFNPVLRELYERLRKAGKAPKLAFIAVARKMLTMLNAIARERTFWEPNT
jgi:transposase